MNLSELVGRWRLFSLAFFVHLSAYFVFRLIFFALNLGHQFSLFDPEVLQSFLHGLRFDTSVIFLLSSPYLLLVFYSGVGQFWKSLRWFFGLLVWIPSCILNVLDAEYFKFTGKRAGFDLFAFQSDALAQAKQLFGQYWFLMLLIACLIGYFIALQTHIEKLLKEQSVRRPFGFNWFGEAVSFVVLFLVVFLGIRGGTQRKPLDLVHAYTFERNELNVLALNSSFTLVKSNRVGTLPDLSDFVDSKSAYLAFRAPLPTASSADLPIAATGTGDRSKMNVMVIIVESLAREYMSYGNNREGFTPFVDSLIPQSLFFPQAFANGRRSIDAAWSLGAGLPALMDEPFPTGPYKGNKIWGIGEMFNLTGRESWFFHGGKNGTMYFDFFARRTGYNHYYGLSEYESDRSGKGFFPGYQDDFDGSWGILDEPFLINMIDVLGRSQKPFFSTVFTLSSHNPYPVPPHLKSRFAGLGSHPMHASIRYADYALEKFFEQVKKQPWYHDTVFVITGDHTSITMDQNYQTDLGYYRVPLMIFSPSLEFAPRISQKIVQHADLTCSLAKLLDFQDKISFKWSPFCNNMFGSRGGEAVFQASGFYTLVTPKRWLRRSEDDVRKLFPMGYEGGFDEKVKPLFEPETEALLEEKRRAAVQLFNNGLNRDDFYLENQTWTLGQ